MIWVPELGMAIADAGELSEAFFRKLEVWMTGAWKMGEGLQGDVIFGFHVKKVC